MPEQLTRPRLKRDETPQSDSYQKRLAAYNRQQALAEATAAQNEQNEREAKTREERDVLAEVNKGVADADTDNAPSQAQIKAKKAADKEKARAKAKAKEKSRVAESGRGALEGRAAQLAELEKEGGA